MDKDTQIDIGVGIFWAAVCGIVATMFWGRILAVVLYLGFKVKWGFPVGVLLVLAINVFHFLFGWFHTEETVGDLAPEEPVLMQSAFQADRIYIRILAVISIGLSLYTQNVLAAYRSYIKDRKQDTDKSHARK